MRKLLVAIAAVVCCIGSLAAATVLHGTSLKQKDGSWRVELGRIDSKSGVAFASWSDSIDEKGWIFWNVSSNGAYSDADQSYGAGFLEGYVLADRIQNSYLNVLEENFGSDTSTIPQEVLDFFMDNLKFVQQKFEENRKDNYWQLAYALLQQAVGLVDGYAAANAQSGWKRVKLDFAHMQIVTSEPDLWDVLAKLDPSRRANVGNMTQDQLIDYVRDSSHCSSIVAIAPDFSDMFAAHATWSSYSEMTRVFRTSDMQLSNPAIKNRRMSFSSYPATLSSTDDFFYLGDSQIVIMETTNDIFNDSMYDIMTSQGLFSWHRVMLANYLAIDGETWENVFARGPSSWTYSNQYQVADFKKFVPGEQLLPGALYVIEQMPGAYVYADMTDALAMGRWYSMNIPYFPEVWEQMGYAAVVEKTKSFDWTWQMAPRAQIFRRNGTVSTLEDLGRLIRYNNWQVDPLSKGTPRNAIMSRYDLDPEAQHRRPAGGLDAKMTSALSAQNGHVRIRAGPTTDDQPPFSWSQFEAKTGEKYAHHGLPDTYDFPWVDLYV
jgi:hypothetical protein